MAQLPYRLQSSALRLKAEVNQNLLASKGLSCGIVPQRTTNGRCLAQYPVLYVREKLHWYGSPYPTVRTTVIYKGTPASRYCLCTMKGNCGPETNKGGKTRIFHEKVLIEQSGATTFQNQGYK